MYLIVILLAFLALQYWGAQNPLHRDQVFGGYLQRFEKFKALKDLQWLQMALALGLPVIGVALIAHVLSPWLWTLLSVVVLLYALGRGEFAPETTAYSLACNESSWAVALHKAQKQGVDSENLTEGDWPELHKRMLQAVAYQGFERLFAVLFWFLFFGPAGALLYRLSFLYRASHKESAIAAKWVWALEWFPARLLGASFAVTGNFVGCINRWKRHVFCTKISSERLLRNTALGALSVDDELVQSCDCTQREIVALKRLYSRTFWFWIACLAFVSLLRGSY